MILMFMMTVIGLMRSIVLSQSFELPILARRYSLYMFMFVYFAAATSLIHYTMYTEKHVVVFNRSDISRYNY